MVIINEKATSYVQDLQGSLEALVRGSKLRLSPDTAGVSGKIFLLRGDLFRLKRARSCRSVARAVLLSRRGTLAEQISRSQTAEAEAPPAAPPRAAKAPDFQCPSKHCNSSMAWAASPRMGGNTSTVLSEGLRTPEPWINVIANPNFGFLASESGDRFHLVAE